MTSPISAAEQDILAQFTFCPGASIHQVLSITTTNGELIVECSLLWEMGAPNPDIRVGLKGDRLDSYAIGVIRAGRTVLKRTQGPVQLIHGTELGNAWTEELQVILIYAPKWLT